MTDRQRFEEWAKEEYGYDHDHELSTYVNGSYIGGES